MSGIVDMSAVQRWLFKQKDLWLPDLKRYHGSFVIDRFAEQFGKPDDHMKRVLELCAKTTPDPNSADAPASWRE